MAHTVRNIQVYENIYSREVTAKQLRDATPKCLSRHSLLRLASRAVTGRRLDCLYNNAIIVTNYKERVKK